MFEVKKIAFVGPGVLAEAMIAGIIRQGMAAPAMMVAAGPRIERLEELQHHYGIEVETDNAKAASQAEVVVLSVKPQRLDRVLAGLRGSIQHGALVLSIVAGASLEKISNGLKHRIVVRSMPNTPAQIGEGITVWTSTLETSEDQRAMARRLAGDGDPVASMQNRLGRPLAEGRLQPKPQRKTMPPSTPTERRFSSDTLPVP